MNNLTIRQYINQYFTRFPNKKYMILKGNLDNITMKNDKKIVFDKPYDFSNNPIHNMNVMKNNYMLISRMKKKYFYIEMINNFNKNNIKNNEPLLDNVIQDINNIGVQEIFQTLNDNNLENLLNDALGEIVNELTIPDEQNQMKPTSNNLDLGIGYLNKDNLEIKFNNNKFEEVKLFICDKKIEYSQVDKSKMIRGNLEVISYKLFEQETLIKLNDNQKPINEDTKPELKYEKINLDFIYYETMNPKTYGTHYCLEENAVEWKIIKGPKYGSYAFSIPPFPDCSQNTPASFIFALNDKDYNKLKEEGKEYINVYTMVKYKNGDNIESKNIQFVLNIK